nr:gloverin [Lymantria dispar]
MQSITLIFFALLAYTNAQVSMPAGYAERYPAYYKYSKIVRHPRDLSWERNFGGGQLFGTLGSTDDSLFGRGGYKQDIFNDDRGRLQGQAYGSRVLGPYGDSSSFGGKLDWSNDNAKLGADIHREIGGRSGMTVTGEGVWELGKNTKLSAGGSVQKTFGHERPDIGFIGNIEHKF